MNGDDTEHDEPDRGDERIAALLEVPPLDDLTRRRLVRRALEAGPAAPARGTRFLRVAAIVVGVAVVGGAAALVLRDDGGRDRETADRSAAPTEATTDEALGAAPGDLGEISDPEVLRERLAAAQAPPPATDADEPESFEEPQVESAVDALAPACLSTLQSSGAESPLLVATGTYRGGSAIVVVAGAAGDTAFVLDQATCALLTSVPLA